MDYINKRDYIDYADDLSPGEQIHVDHTNCPAGEDTRSRLYIKRTEDGGKLLAHCHNCGLSGSYTEDNYRPVQGKTKLIKNRSNTNYASQVDRITSSQQNKLQDARAACRTWLTRYGITEAEVKRYRIGFDEEFGVTLPVYINGKLVGWQERSFKSDQPKYKTKALIKPLWWFGEPLQSSNIIDIVEDMLSGIKCARFVPTIALLGANMSDELLAFLVKTQKSSRFIVFLDDDNRQIKLNQLKIKRSLEQMGYKVTIITGIGKDPKACSNAELEKMLL